MGCEQQLADAAARWSADVGSADDVIRAAADVVADGGGGDLLVRLAALPYGSYESDFAEIVRAALAEVGVPSHVPGSAEARMAVLKLMAEDVVRGKMSARELARWAHQAIGHEGPSAAQVLVDLDDRLDLAEYMSDDLVSIEDAVVRAAKQLTGS